MSRPLPAKLPCFPCPHDAICCSWGTGLYEDEATAERYGEGALRWSDEEVGWRTSIVDGRCFFWRHGCSIDEMPFYPRVCRGFPWLHGNGGDEYPGDLSVCPELAG